MSTNREFIKVLAIITACFFSASGQPAEYSGNPVFKDLFTADPCAIVHNDTLYVFTGHDEQTREGTFFLMRDWYTFSTTDITTGQIMARNSGPAISHGQVAMHLQGMWWSIMVSSGGMFP